MSRAGARLRDGAEHRLYHSHCATGYTLSLETAIDADTPPFANCGQAIYKPERMSRGADKPFSRSYACGEGVPALLGRCIGEMLDRSAAVYPDGDALIVCHQNIRYTWKQLLYEVELTARGLLRLGVKKGDRVGIWSTNCAEWIVLQFATAKAGAILVNINPANRAFELEYVLRQSECQILCVGQGFRDCDYGETLLSISPEIG